MIIYRCENDLEEGPYSITAAFYDERHILLKHHTENMLRWPTPNFDGIKVLEPSSWFCAFASIEQMTKWFSKHERIELRKLGWKFLKLETTSEVHVGHHQCVFHRKDAQIIEELTI